MKNRYLIGEFSDMTGISKRMLRHYEKLSLFNPIETNEENGYRYYSENQIAEIDQIQCLKKLGFTLSSIQDILSQPIEISEFIKLLKDKEASLTKDSDELKSSLLMTNRLITILENNSLKTLPSILKLLDWERSIKMTNNVLEATVNLKELMNRDMFNEKIDEIFTRDNNDNYHFITFDIDNFMHVNDFDGYEVGDLVIQNVFSLIINSLKPLLDETLNENLLARLGGDEISVFLKNSDHSKVIEHVDKTIKTIDSFDFSQIGSTRKVTVSCGIAYGKRTNHVAKIKDVSLKALIQAKRNGRNQYLLTEYGV